jgi:hypothetical protein
VNEYLFNVSGDAPGADIPSEDLSGQMFFAWWKTRQAPYNEISEGDRLWWVDKGSREVRWELRATEILKRPYNSHFDATEMLRRAYGVVLEHGEYSMWSDSGWLLAVAVDVMGPVSGVRLPPSVHLGRNGYRKIDQDLRRSLESAGLPSPRTEITAHHPAYFNASAIARVFAPPPSRTIPLHVKEEVRHRDQGRCKHQGCKVTDPGDLQFDHIRPWSKGGENEASNLQLLCSAHNRSKGASMPEEARTELYEEPVEKLCFLLETAIPSDERKLEEVIAKGVQAGHLELAEEVVQSLARDYSDTGQHLEVALDALEESGGSTDLTKFYRAWLGDDDDTGWMAEYVASSDERVAHEAAILFRLEGDDSERTMSALKAAAGSADPWIAAGAQFAPLRMKDEWTNEDRETIEDLTDSPAMLWRTLACKELAYEYYNNGFGSQEEVRHFFELLDAAIACPLRDHAEEAMLLLATYLTEAVPDHKSRTATFYSSVLIDSEDPEIRSKAAELLKVLETRTEKF